MPRLPHLVRPDGRGSRVNAGAILFINFGLSLALGWAFEAFAPGPAAPGLARPFGNLLAVILLANWIASMPAPRSRAGRRAIAAHSDWGWPILFYLIGALLTVLSVRIPATPDTSASFDMWANIAFSIALGLHLGMRRRGR